MKLKDKVAIITGGGRGLGRAITVAMANEGAKLMIVSRTSRELEATVGRTGLQRDRIIAAAADISNENNVKKFVDLAFKKFGSVDILVNNAAIIAPISAIATVNTSEWVKNIQTNLVGTFLCIRHTLPKMIAHGHGKIINIAGSGDKPLPDFSAYSASKSAVIRLTETLAEEVRRYGIDVNAVAPGAIFTRMTREIEEAIGTANLRRIRSHPAPLEPSADLVVFLASAESDGLTGKIVSSIHDDWRSKRFLDYAKSVSDSYTMRRKEL